MERKWICERQRAGNLVKIQKALRPRMSKLDSLAVAAEKRKVKCDPLRSSVRRRPVDRAELMLALMGEASTSYVLTFFDSMLPGSYREARERFSAFLGRMRRYHGGCFDYVYCIEGKHGDKRWHVHITLRDADFDEDEVLYCWGYGENEYSAPLLLDKEDSYFRTARYYTKEKTDGIRIPIDAKTWGCARRMYEKLPALERWEGASGKIWIPNDALILLDDAKRNRFGAYHYVIYQLPSK